MGDLKQQIFEMRYKPNPAIIDKRGTYSKLFSKELKFDNWTIINDGMIIDMKDKSKKAFITADRIGYVINDASVIDGFRNETIRFLQMFFALDIIDEEIHVTRIGVRTRDCTKFNDTFQMLRSVCLERYISIPQPVLDKIGLELKDVGYPMIYRDGQTTVSTNCGPMEKEQISDFFKDYKNGREIPEVGLYVDIDYFTLPDKLLNANGIISTVSDYCINAEKKCEIIKSIILR